MRRTGNMFFRAVMTDGANHLLSLSQGSLFSSSPLKVQPPVLAERKSNTFQFRPHCLVPFHAHIGTLHSSWWTSEKVFQYAGESAPAKRSYQAVVTMLRVDWHACLLGTPANHAPIPVFFFLKKEECPLREYRT